MFKNYLLISWRNLIRNKGFSLINLLGLAVGMTCTLLIILWVQDELNFDKFQHHYSSIYRVMAHRMFDNQTGTDYSMPFPLAEAIENEIPQVQQAVVTSHTSAVNVRYQDQIYHLKGITVSANFLEVFSVSFQQSSGKNPIDDPHAIILTESWAENIFGDQDPLNQIITVSDRGEFKVTGVIADLPANSSIQFDYLTSFNYHSDYIRRNQQEWSTSSWVVYVKVIPGADMAEIDKRINEIKHFHDPEDREISTYFTFPMSRWRLYSDFNQGVNTGGLIQQVRLFTLIAIIILVIACVNFMNLSTARSERRAKEVGIRKTLGSQKYQLVYQFFMESLILALLAFLLTLLAVKLLLPSFNQLVSKELVLDLTSPQLILTAFGIIVITGLFAGSYPALFLSSFHAVKVLKSTVSIGKGAVKPRQVLMIFQFVISILLISATVIVYQQITMVKHRDLGYQPDHLITVPGSRDTQTSFDALKQEVLNTGMVASLTRTMSPITNIWWHLPAPSWPGKTGDTQIIFSALTAGSDFTKTMGIKMVSGRDFSGSPADSSYVLLNQAAVDAMGVDDPVGMPLRHYGDYTVLGVTENVVQESPYHPVKPMIVFYKPVSSKYITIRLKHGIQPQQALAPIEDVFNRFNPTNAFDFSFVDQEFALKFANEELIGRLSNLFAALAIFICCLGLAGLAAFNIERRVMEIGMRKILGASLHQLVMLISQDFIKLIFIAFVTAVPISWWFMNRWLDNYALRIDISIWVYGGVGLGVMLLALLVVWLNTLKTAMGNPIKNLKSEI